MFAGRALPIIGTANYNTCLLYTSAITSYLYQSWILQKNYPEVASTIRRIAQVEMHHINILGDLIIRLSGNPKYISYQPRGTVFWNGRMVPQFDQIGKYLELSLIHI